MLGAALDAYRLDNGRYPTTEQGLNALWEKPFTDLTKLLYEEKNEALMAKYNLRLT